jgi:hypothetical protein
MEEYAKKITIFYPWMINHCKFHVVLSLYYVSILNLIFCTQIMCNKNLFFNMLICKFSSFSKEVVDIS